MDNKDSRCLHILRFLCKEEKFPRQTKEWTTDKTKEEICRSQAIKRIGNHHEKCVSLSLKQELALIVQCWRYEENGLEIITAGAVEHTINLYWPTTTSRIVLIITLGRRKSEAIGRRVQGPQSTVTLRRLRARQCRLLQDTSKRPMKLQLHKPVYLSPSDPSTYCRHSV
jgi:hypothetical protein